MTRWINDFRTAVIRNEVIAARTIRPGEKDRSPEVLLAHATDEMRAAVASSKATPPNVNFRFLQDRHRTRDIETCVARGYGACSDYSAWLCGVALAAGRAEVRICFETLWSIPDYAHVRVVVDGHAEDPVATQAFEVPRCDWTLNVRTLITDGLDAALKEQNPHPRS